MYEKILHHNGSYNLWSSLLERPLFECGLTFDQLRYWIIEEYGYVGLERAQGILQYAQSKGAGVKRKGITLAYFIDWFNKENKYNSSRKVKRKHGVLSELEFCKIYFCKNTDVMPLADSEHEAQRQYLSSPEFKEKLKKGCEKSYGIDWVLDYMCGERLRQYTAIDETIHRFQGKFILGHDFDSENMLDAPRMTLEELTDYVKGKYGNEGIRNLPFHLKMTEMKGSNVVFGGFEIAKILSLHKIADIADEQELEKMYV